MMTRSWIIPAAFVIFVAHALAGAADKRLDIYWIDVEGGAATLIVTPTGQSLLVDSGWPGNRDSERIAKVAKEAGLKEIDFYLTTHFHMDHFGGIGALVKLIPVKQFYDHGVPSTPGSDIPADLLAAYRLITDGKSITLKPGDTIPLAQARGIPKLGIRIVASNGIVVGEKQDASQIRACSASSRHVEQPEDKSDNARSVAFILTFGGWTFFDGGDLTWNVEHKLVCPQNLVGKVDVYQVTHHGAAESNSPAIVEALDPRAAIMNNGARKGGAARVVKTVKTSPGLQAVFALHRNTQTGEADNASPEVTANGDEKCSGNEIRLSVAPDAKTYSVLIPSTGVSRKFSKRQE